MLFVSMNGPRQEVVALLCVCGATPWGQGKCGLKTVFWWVLRGVYIFKGTANSGREAKLGNLGSLVSPETARAALSVWLLERHSPSSLKFLCNHNTIYSGIIHESIKE